MASMMGPRGGLFSVWKDLNDTLPVGSDQVDKLRRDQIFNELDTQGNGIIRQADFGKGMFRRMPAVKGIADMHGLVKQAFVAGRAMIEPIAMLGDNQLDRNQFRGVLLYLHGYFKLWDLFLQNGVESGELFAARDLDRLVPVLRDWGVQDLDSWESSPEEVFRQLDLRGAGAVNFNQLADFAIRHALPHLMDSSEAAEEERTRAKQLIKKWLPHVAQRENVPARPGWNGTVPPVAPPGQKRPPRAILGARAEFEQKRAGSPNSRWTTQYQCDYHEPVKRSLSTGALSIATEEQPNRGYNGSAAYNGSGYNVVATTSWPMARGASEVTLPVRAQQSPGGARVGQMATLSPTRRQLPATLLRAGGMLMAPKVGA